MKVCHFEVHTFRFFEEPIANVMIICCKICELMLLKELIAKLYRVGILGSLQVIVGQYSREHFDSG